MNVMAYCDCQNSESNYESLEWLRYMFEKNQVVFCIVSMAVITLIIVIIMIIWKMGANK